MSEATLIEEPGRFSWALALAGGAVAIAVTLLLLLLGSGVGLLLVHPMTAITPSMPAFLTGGAIYFLVAQAFGFAVGGHLAGRLLGPMIETTFQEEVRAAAHGLVAWASAVIGTLVLVAIAGASLAALYGAAAPNASSAPTSAYEVDRLFRPPTTQASPTPASASPTAIPSPAVGGPESSSADQPAPDQITNITPAPDYAPSRAARGEATRLVEAGMLRGDALLREDRDRLITLISQGAGVPRQEAALRVAAADTEAHLKARHAADVARKTVSYASLWMALALAFGALVAMVAAVMARIEDDRESPWSLFAFHRGWR